MTGWTSVLSQEFGVTGEDCSQLASLGRWEALQPSNRGVSPPGSASHAAVLVGNFLYLLGGESFGSADLVYTYNLLRNQWKRLKTSQPPAPRYGHTAVLHKNVIYMYGGALEKGRVSSELWAFNLSSRAWQNITVVPENCEPAMCGPIQLVGHSANVVFDEYMVVFFGYSPQYGIVNIVQEYHFGGCCSRHRCRCTCTRLRSSRAASCWCMVAMAAPTAQPAAATARWC